MNKKVLVKTKEWGVLKRRYREKNRYLRTESGRFAGAGVSYDRYDEEYNPTKHTTNRGIRNVGLPDGLKSGELKKYIDERSGPVKSYNIKNKGE